MIVPGGFPQDKAVKELLTSNDYVALNRATKEAQQFLCSLQMPKAIVYFVTLTIEELISRCIRFGYPDTKAHQIELKITVAFDEVTLRIIDDAEPYNPAVQPEPFQEPPTPTQRIEGLGMTLVRTIASEIFYARHDGKNVSTFRKRLRI